MYKTVFNPTDTAVVVSGDGHVVGGHDWGTVETTDDVAKHALAQGWLLEANRPDGDTADMNPRAVEAFDRTDEISARADRVRQLDKAELQDVAVEAGLVDADESVRKNELVDTVAQSDADVSKTEKKTTRRKSQEA